MLYPVSEATWAGLNVNAPIDPVDMPEVTWVTP
jgi:hypothetical protein